MQTKSAGFSVPILFIVFNRPDVTSRVMESIRRRRPTDLIIAADGPRLDRLGEERLCDEVRSIATAVDWPCEVTRLFADENRGCGTAVRVAIDYAMQRYDRLIILEDDCLPTDDFYPFCEQLLDRYSDDDRIASIGGSNFQGGIARGVGDYYYSQYSHCWGWATWRRAWERYDFDISDWPVRRETSWLSDRFDRPVEVAYWTEIFDSVYAKRIDTWDFQWLYACWVASALTALPNAKIVENLGYGDQATHTDEIDPNGGTPVSRLVPRGPGGIYRSPATMAADPIADRVTDSMYYSGAVRATRSRGIAKRFRKLWRSGIGRVKGTK